MGQTWTLAPHLSGLAAAEGGFETPLGWFGAKWTSAKGKLTLTVSTPEGTDGVVTVPQSGKVTVDGKTAKVGQGGTLSMTGGNHTVVASS